VDTDFDTLGDGCDDDDDADGILDVNDPFPLDTDNDGLDNDVDTDDDNDGLSDLDETTLYPGGIYNPLKADTDLNGTPDGQEDYDGDNLVNVDDPLPLLINYADGDLDDNGTVDVADSLLAMRIASGLLTTTTVHLQHGDVTPMGATDGVIDLSDALMVMRKAAGLVAY
jgi:hypothetical protein